MDMEEAKMIAKAYFEEKEEREKIASEKATIESKKKKKFGLIKELIIGTIVLGGLYMIWRSLEPIINMTNW
jgi:hypothetical protein